MGLVISAFPNALRIAPYATPKNGTPRSTQSRRARRSVPAVGQGGRTDTSFSIDGELNLTHPADQDKYINPESAQGALSVRQDIYQPHRRVWSFLVSRKVRVW